MKKNIALILTLLLLAMGCSQKETPLRISINPWIGFTPLFYADQQGWLKDSGIKFVWVVGLEENVKLYRQGLVEGFAATQYEYLSLKQREDVKPFFLIDRSNGADVVLANRTLESLQQSQQIDVYLEITGLNNDLLNAFIEQYGIERDTLNLHPSDPMTLTTMNPENPDRLVITYEPYATAIEKNGFKRVASTKDLKDFMVIDALWFNTETAQHHGDKFDRLKKAIDRAIDMLRQDPEGYYGVVKGYLEGQSYQEFLKSLEGIIWVNHTPEEVVTYLGRNGIPTDAIIP